MALLSDSTKVETTARALKVGLLKNVVPLAGIVTFLVVWQLVVIVYHMPPYLLPTPTAIANAFVDQLPSLLSNGWVTVYEMLVGYGMAVGIAIPLAIAITSSQRFNEFVMPTVLFFQIVPKVAIAPLFLVWFGVGSMPKILVAFLISFFPIVIDTAVGLRSMSAEMGDLARSMGATRMQIFTQFRLPTSLPYLFSGLKVAATLAIAGTVVGEFEHGNRADVRHHRGADDHRLGLLLHRGTVGRTADPLARHPSDPRRGGHDVSRPFGAIPEFTQPPESKLRSLRRQIREI
jgi:NitT/TauT family transport system permease protein